jgi:dihydroflavonol-4-reductase
VEQIYHLAGFVSRNPEDATQMYRVHVDGTRLLLEAAKRSGAKRVVVASSSGTVAVGPDPDRIYTEEDGYATDRVAKWPYYLSKIYQEQLAIRFGKDQGLEVIVVCPSLLLGPGDDRLSSSGDVLKFLTGSIPTIPPGGLNFVDARDAAFALVLAMRLGRPGQRYLTGGPNWTFTRFFEKLSMLSHVEGPKLRLPSRVQTFGARLIEEVARFQGRKPTLDTVTVEMAQQFWYLDSRKARHELGFEARDPDFTLLDTIRYLRERFTGKADALARR